MYKMKFPKELKVPDLKSQPTPEQKEMRSLAESWEKPNANPLKTKEDNKTRQRWHRLKGKLGI